MQMQKLSKTDIELSLICICLTGIQANNRRTRIFFQQSADFRRFSAHNRNLS